jgi:hypothetical protein
MSKEHEYRLNAAETVELANKVATAADKGRLLGLAEKWLDLADMVGRQSRSPRTVDNHPLVEERFTGD